MIHSSNLFLYIPEADVGALRLWGDQVPLLRALLHLLHLHRTNMIKISNDYDNNHDNNTPSFLHMHKTKIIQTKQNIAKGTADPRVEFTSQVITRSNQTISEF